MKQPLETEAIGQAIGALFDEICKRYMTDASVPPLILSNDAKQAENLRILDGLHQSVLTSLQFGQYRRAVWYLQAFSLVCHKTFGEGNQARVLQALRSRIQI